MSICRALSMMIKNRMRKDAVENAQHVRRAVYNKVKQEEQKDQIAEGREEWRG
jgi:hypothetical protein